MNSNGAGVTALAINMTNPETLRRTDRRRAETFTLTALITDAPTRSGSLPAAHRALR
jgi:hypothetical protein